MGAKRVTLQDVADRTGFTVNTVSRALKNKPDISSATCEHIQKVAQEMGYVRNYMASSLRSGRTKTIGLIVGGMSNPYYAIMADEIQNVCVSLGYSLMILCSRDNPDLELHVVETAMSRQVDGILLFPSSGARRSIERMQAAHMPYVLMSRYLEPDRDDCVICSEEHGAYLATRHLIDQGRRKLGMLCGYDIVFSTAQRQAGFLRACEEAGIPPEDRHMHICIDRDGIARTLTDWRRSGVNGVFFFCDMEAWNAVHIMEELGLRIPEDIAVTAFDNIQSKLHFPWPLCTVDCSHDRMIREAIDLLRQRIHQEDFPPRTIEVESTLVCRGSCGCSPAKPIARWREGC